MSRKFGLFLVFAAALPLAIVSTAWACGVLATVKLDKRVVSPGDEVAVTGKNYSNSAAATPVTIRLRNRAGQILTTTPADASNNISDRFRIPAGLAPGWYVVLATQFIRNADGSLTVKAGTPARTTVRIQGSSAAAAAVSPWSNATPSGPGASSTPVAGDGGQTLPVALAAILSLGFLAGGVTLVGRRARTATRPHLSV